MTLFKKNNLGFFSLCDYFYPFCGFYANANTLYFTPELTVTTTFVAVCVPSAISTAVEAPNSVALIKTLLGATPNPCATFCAEPFPVCSADAKIAMSTALTSPSLMSAEVTVESFNPPSFQCCPLEGIITI